MSTTSPKKIREFHGDNVWRDEEGTIWMRWDESIAMQSFAWEQARAASADIAQGGSVCIVPSCINPGHKAAALIESLENPFQNALVVRPPDQN